MKKFVYLFTEGNQEMKALLGGKGANLAEMSRLGLPVPPGFTITTDACKAYFNQEQQLSNEIITEIEKAILGLEEKMQKKFNDSVNPLLVSVRSGAVYSMPGMTDTILNLGLNDQTVIALAELTDNPRFAYDCYRRLIQMFGEVVMEIPAELFEKRLTELKKSRKAQQDTELTAEDWQLLVKEFQEIYLAATKTSFPQDAKQQLYLAIKAVFNSWYNPRADVYRKLHNIPNDLGTAVNIQTMVFGNLGNTSGTGVAFTRNPATGAAELFGEFLLNAQGEDVVAGIRTPLPLDQLAQQLPAIYSEFKQLATSLEAHYHDMQDIEFTIEKEKLYLLQTRNGKRTAAASLQIAIDLVKEGVISKQEAILRIEPEVISQLLHPVFSTHELEQATSIAVGLPASPGAATGRIYFHASEAKLAKERGENVILMRQETSPEDIEGMIASEAIVTSRGGMTSHAAVVARGMGTCCVAGCGDLLIQEEMKQISYGNGAKLSEGDIVSVDGTTGRIYLGAIPTQTGAENPNLAIFMGWLTAYSQLGVRANADTPKDIQTALDFGAAGIGLTRTEHMFFAEERLLKMRQMILADSLPQREVALASLLDMQMADFTQLFMLTAGKPITIRLLDPPLHEFLPHTHEEIAVVAHEMQVTEAEINKRLADLAEMNPMLGHRGCRLAISYPEIYQMQVTAIIKSALLVEKKGICLAPEIMLPLIGSSTELHYLKKSLVGLIDQLLIDAESHMSYKIGTMIEIPRACLTADEIAAEADFFSFGTNDLTQLTFGFSRDDIGKFLGTYLKEGLLPADPFQTVDIAGVGALMQLAVTKGRQAKPQLKIGVCGEVGGDPESINFFQKLGLDYVSCSPYRVPIARLAAAQANLRGN